MFSLLKTDFATRLGVTEAKQILVLGDFLESLDLFLTQKGLIFSTSLTKEKKVYRATISDYGFGRSYFDLGSWVQKTGITVIAKSLDDLTQKILLPEKDYFTSNSILDLKPIFAITLRDSYIGEDQFLEVEGAWRFGEVLPLDLKLAGLDLASQYLASFNQNLLNQNGQTVSSTSIDKVSFSYKQNKNDSSFSNVKFQSVLSKYLL